MTPIPSEIGRFCLDRLYRRVTNNAISGWTQAATHYVHCVLECLAKGRGRPQIVVDERIGRSRSWFLRENVNWIDSIGALATLRQGWRHVDDLDCIRFRSPRDEVVVLAIASLPIEH
jgi:hypothetical protein